MDEVSIESVVCRFRDEYSDQAREPIAGSSAAATVCLAADECTSTSRPHQCASSVEFGSIRKARAGSLRAPESVFENGTDHDGRRGGGKCQRPVLNSVTAAVQPGRDQCGRSPAWWLPPGWGSRDRYRTESGQ